MIPPMKRPQGLRACGKAIAAIVAAAGAAVLLAPQAHASGATYGREARLAGATAVLPNAENEWNYNFGVGFGTAPSYFGDKDYETHLSPLIDIDWRQRIFLSTQRGLGAILFRNSSFRLGSRLTYDQGRDNGDSSFIRRLPDVDPSFEAGLFFENYSAGWRLWGDARKGLQSDGHNGILGSLGVDRAGRISERASLVAGASVTAANKRYNDAYFGVPRNTAGFVAAGFTPEAGIRDIGAHVNLIFQVTDQIYFTVDATLNLLLGDPSKSPIVREDLPFFVGTSLGVRF
jgi:outer membrane scaffolding protein for murein synthesis (MipA/OmpV family)